MSKNEDLAIKSQEFMQEAVAAQVTQMDFMREYKPALKDIVNKKQEPDNAISDKINETFNLVGAIKHPAKVDGKDVQVVDPETGEVTDTRVYRDATRTILFSDTGETYACTSMTLWNSFSDICCAMGAGPSMWPEPIPVKIRQGKTSSGGLRYWLEIQ